MTRAYKPRRASKRWTNDAPAWVLDCFDHPQFADRYTVIFGGDLIEGNGTFRNTWLHYLSTSENGGVSGIGEFEAHTAAAYRYRNKNRRIAWRDLPEPVKAMATRFATED